MKKVLALEKQMLHMIITGIVVTFAVLLVLLLAGIAWAATDWKCYYDCYRKNSDHNYCTRLCTT